MSEPKTIDIEPAQTAPPQSQALAHREAGGAVAQTQGNPLDMEPAAFSAGLDRRKQNRKSLMDWIREALVDGVDFGRIHTEPKSRCTKGKFCDNKNHFSKNTLFKPGAEKICGMLGVTATFPTLPDYEAACLQGVVLKNILLRCAITNSAGVIIAEGVGARSCEKDYGDINKSLKMAEKSAHIDATLRMAGLSEVFTQDIEDMNLGEQAESSAKGQNSSQPSAPPAGRAAAPAAKATPRPAPKAAQTAPAATKTAVGADKPYAEQWKARFLKRTNRPDIYPFAWLWAVEVGACIPNERLEAGDADKFPQNMPAEEAAFKLIAEAARKGFTPEQQAEFDAVYGPGAPPPDDPPPEAAPKVNVPRDKKTDQPEAEGKEWWRAVKVPFGKDKGLPIEELSKNSLFGWWANWKAEGYKGNDPTAADLEFRAALDAAGEHYQFKAD